MDGLIDGTIYDLRMINDDDVFAIVDTIQWQRIPPAGATKVFQSRPGVRVSLPPFFLVERGNLETSKKEKLYQRNFKARESRSRAVTRARIIDDVDT